MRLHLETPRVEIQGLEKKTMVTSLKHPGKKQSGSSSRLPLTWTKRATPPALAHSTTSTGPWDRQMDRMTDIERLKTLRQTDAQTRCRNLQGPARPGDHCAVLALGTHAQPGSWDQPTSAWGHCKPHHPATPPSRHPATPVLSERAGTPPPGARDTRSPDAAAADAKARALTANAGDAHAPGTVRAQQTPTELLASRRLRRRRRFHPSGVSRSPPPALPAAPPSMRRAAPRGGARAGLDRSPRGSAPRRVTGAAPKG